MQALIKCLNCLKEFFTYKCLADRKKYCSKECQYVHKTKRFCEKHNVKRVRSHRGLRCLLCKYERAKLRPYKPPKNKRDKNKILELYKRHSDSLSEVYIKKCIANRSKLKPNEIPKELIEAKRIQLQIIREIRKLKKGEIT